MRFIWLAASLLLPGCAAADNVLVLPFFNTTADASLDWVGESIGETVRDALHEAGVVTLSREDREEAYRRLAMRPYALLTKASVIKLGGIVDATHIVYGQFEIAPGAEADPPEKRVLRIVGRVLNRHEMRQGSDLLEIGAFGDLAGLQSRVAWLMLRQVAGAQAPPEEEFRRRRPPLRVDALEAYTRGLLAPAPEQKLQLFTQAARLDERFSAPCFEVGRLYARQGDYRFAPEWLQRVKPDESRYAEAQFWLGVSLYYTGDFEKAAAAFREVSARVPLNEVWNNLGAAISRLKRPEAIEHLQKAVAGDDADPDYHFNLGYALWKQQRFEEAATAFRNVLERNADDPEATLFLGRCLKGTGPRANDPRSDGLERLKRNYEEDAWRQLKATLETKPPPALP